MVIFLVWFFTTALYAVPVFIGARRLMRHLKDNQERVKRFRGTYSFRCWGARRNR